MPEFHLKPKGLVEGLIGILGGIVGVKSLSEVSSGLLCDSLRANATLGIELCETNPGS